MCSIGDVNQEYKVLLNVYKGVGFRWGRVGKLGQGGCERNIGGRG